MKLTSKQRDQIAGTAFVTLPILGIFLFVGIPLIVSFVLSFGHLSSFDLFDIDFSEFGSNYVRIFKDDPKYIRSIANTFISISCIFSFFICCHSLFISSMVV